MDSFKDKIKCNLKKYLIKYVNENKEKKTPRGFQNVMSVKLSELFDEPLAEDITINVTLTNFPKLIEWAENRGR